MNRTVWAVVALVVVIALAMYLFYDGSVGGDSTLGDGTITTPAPTDPATPAPATPSTP